MTKLGQVIYSSQSQIALINTTAARPKWSHVHLDIYIF